MGLEDRTLFPFEQASDSAGVVASDGLGAATDSHGGTCDSYENAPNRTTLDAIEKSEQGIGLNGPFESLDEMLKVIKNNNEK